MSLDYYDEISLPKDSDGHCVANVNADVLLQKTERSELLPAKGTCDFQVHQHGGQEGNRTKNSTKLSTIVQRANSQNPDVKLEAIQMIRDLLSNVPSCKIPPIDELISLGALPVLVECLRQKENPLLQVEAAWSLTNIAAGNTQHTRAVVDAGAVSPLIDLLRSSSYEIITELAVWALGNIAGDGPASRDCILRHNIVPSLLRFIKPGTSLTFSKNLAWMMVNLCRDEERLPPKGSIGGLLSVICGLIQHATDKHVLNNGITALSYISRSGTENVQKIVDCNILPRLVSLLSPNIIQPSTVRVLGDIAAGAEEHKQELLDSGILKYLLDLLLLPPNPSNGTISRDAARIVSEIASGSRQHAQSLIDAGILPVLLYNLTTASFEVQKEFVRTILNLTKSGHKFHMSYLMSDLRVIPKLCNLITVGDPELLKMVLESLHNMLDAYGHEFRLVAKEIELCGGLDKIESIQNRENEEIYKLTRRIVERCFPDDQSSVEYVPEPPSPQLEYETWQYEFVTEDWLYNP